MCPKNSNPADFFMDMMTKDNIPYKEDPDPEVLKQNLAIRDEKFAHRVDIFTNTYQDSDLKLNLDSEEFK